MDIFDQNGRITTKGRPRPILFGFPPARGARTSSGPTTLDGAPPDFWRDDAVAVGLPATDRSALAAMLAPRTIDDDYARADRLLDMRDRLGLGIGVDPDMVRQIRGGCRYALWAIADEPAATPADVPRRERIFSRHQGGPGDLLRDVLAAALARDRALHGLVPPPAARAAADTVGSGRAG
ncbi:hypothetical protein [Lichenibacterium dinghuense]|uniref:hypothetical protein n=1 Tax=Lichenibacterium dinghuense TaxID=2895977 RepID=UPI001F3CF96A|nr:hypothetical protein [Lichenibacterium sp. 6Y81]